MGNKKKVLYENKDEVIRLSKEGKSNAFIGSKFGCSGALVGLFLKDYNIVSKQLERARAADLTKFKEEITKRYESGQSVHFIAKDMGLSNGLVNVYLKRWGYVTSGGRGRYKGGGLLKDKTAEIIRMYTEEKIGVDTIAKRLGCAGGASVRTILQQHNLMRTWEDNRYQVDQSYFEKIDTRNKAYVLGFMYSDGNVVRDMSIWRIALKYDDVEILLKIKDDIKYTGDLGYTENRVYKKRNGEQSIASPQYKLAVGRSKMCRDLVKLGCMPNKTWQIRFPPANILPREFVADFCRGYWDGDGSISNRHPALSVLGNKFFISEMMTYLPIQGSPPGFYQQSTKFPDDPDKQLVKYSIGIKYGSLEVLKFLYGNNPTLYMERKYKKAQFWIDELESRLTQT